MNIEKNYDGKELTLAIDGRIDTITSQELDKEIQSEIGNFDSLIMDFTNLEYISSAGLRVILSAQKIMNKQGSMKVTNVQDIVMEVFESTGFVDILTIE